MYFRPSLIFIIIWAPPLTIMSIFSGGIIESLDNSFLFYILFITSFFVFFDILFGFAYPRKLGAFPKFPISLQRVDNFLFILLVLWLIIYFINIIGSGGVPIIWVISGINKTYVDFGLPTLGGLGNLMRAFALTVFTYLYFIRYRRKRSLFWIVFLLFTAFIVETGRGNGLVLALHGFGVWAIMRPLKLKYLPIMFLVFFLFLLALGSIQVIRYPDGFITLTELIDSQGVDVSGSLILTLLAPTFLYWVVPIVNTQLNFLYIEWFNFSPNYSFAKLIPTIFRNHFNESNRDYGILVNEANNTTSFLLPLFRDFGVFGAALAAIFIIGITSFVYHRARAGYFSSFFFWPPIFMSLVLTNFSLFYTSLVVFLFPVLIFIFKWYIRETHVQK